MTIVVAAACGVAIYFVVNEKSKVTYGREIPAEQRALIDELVNGLERCRSATASHERNEHSEYVWQIEGNPTWTCLFPDIEDKARLPAVDAGQIWSERIWSKVAAMTYDRSICAPLIITNRNEYVIAMIPVTKAQFAVILNLDGPLSSDSNSVRDACVRSLGSRTRIHVYDSRHGFRSTEAKLLMQMLLTRN
ncbi:MAG: hypothetical protein V4719_14645 [Planctomycetota bacterium]